VATRVGTDKNKTTKLIRIMCASDRDYEFCSKKRILHFAIEKRNNSNFQLNRHIVSLYKLCCHELGPKIFFHRSKCRFSDYSVSNDVEMSHTTVVMKRGPLSGVLRHRLNIFFNGMFSSRNLNRI